MENLLGTDLALCKYSATVILFKPPRAAITSVLQMNELCPKQVVR